MRVLLALLLLVIAAPLQAQSMVRTSVDTTLVTVGDRITLTVSVEHSPTATVAWPDSLDLSPFEIVGARALGTEPAGPRVRSSAEFLLTAFELGELEIPDFEVAVLDPSGERELLQTDRFGVEVVSVGADEGGDIREIRGPFMIPVGTIVIALWVLLLLALIGGAWFGYRRWRASRGEVEVDRSVPVRPAHEIALEALADIEASRMLARGQVKEYHIAVSDTLRRYVEARYHVPALEMTTWEIVSGLERVGVGRDFTEGMRRLLDQCDLVKFAKVRPDEERSRGVLTLGREIVEASVSWMPEQEDGPDPETAPVLEPDSGPEPDTEPDRPEPDRGPEPGDAASTLSASGEATP